MSEAKRAAISQKMAKNPSSRLDSVLRGRDRNIAEKYDNVNTIPTQHLLAQSYIWQLSLSLYTAVCWWNIWANRYSTVYEAYHLTGVQAGIFIGENDCYFVLQEITAFMSENVYMKNRI